MLTFVIHFNSVLGTGKAVEEEIGDGEEERAKRSLQSPAKSSSLTGNLTEKNSIDSGTDKF